MSDSSRINSMTIDASELSSGDIMYHPVHGWARQVGITDKSRGTAFTWADDPSMIYGLKDGTSLRVLREKMV